MHMIMLERFRMQHSKNISRLLRHFSRQLDGTHNNAVVIAAAVRTPRTPFKAEEQKLAGIVIDELVKRTLVPREEFKKLIVCCSSNASASDCNARLANVAKELGLKSCEAHALQDDICSITGLRMTLDSLREGKAQCIITGDTRCQFLEPDDGLLANELMTVHQAPARGKQTAKADPSEPTPTLGAAALAWTTYETAERLQLQPLALVREFAVKNNREDALYHVHGGQPLLPSQIHTWDLVTSREPPKPSYFHLDLSGNNLCTHDNLHITASHLLTHLVHSLPAGELGCAYMDGSDGRLMIIFLEKLKPKIAQVDGLPLLTLYTKKPCPLCDDLVSQLEQKYAGKFRLEKVYIDRKENVRYLRLFRHDIPVLFFNGQFLCMHKLNEEALRERLAGLE
ncbi:uncharacterized protein [Drosophila pseudoobscura]|uniref:Glutaredoxin domain-containing protein n=1 Tax=Drosophila pseudoobscura pseudoobscura TaxID=46245 RepID=A0A6I8UL34_DROPS|nr:uncharacterized protein LOC4818120 [Drosophila pseudoobscura]